MKRNRQKRVRKKLTKKQQVFLEVCLLFLSALLIGGGVLIIYIGQRQLVTIEESSVAASSHVSVNEFEKVLKMQITLQFGKNQEVLDRRTLSNWASPKEKTNGDIGIEVNDEPIRAYAHSLAEKYDTFVDTIALTTHYGEEIHLLNKSTGWILDEDYAFEALKKMVLTAETVSVNLTDNSVNSKKWWVRIAGEYQPHDSDPADYIEVSISNQYMWVYKNHKQVLDSPVVTGNPNMGNDTPKGAFTVDNKKKKATLYSESYNTVVEYWIGLDHQIGFHDASWQDDFGGEIYLTDGSHGCVNMPTDAVSKLYEIAYINMPVFIY